MIEDLTGTNTSANTTSMNGVTVEPLMTNTECGGRTQCSNHTRRGGQLSGQKRKAQRAHTPPGRHNQTSARTLLEIPVRPTPTGLVKKDSRELWNRWKAQHKPRCTQHVDAFRNYVVFEMVKARFGNKLKIVGVGGGLSLFLQSSGLCLTHMPLFWL